MLVYRDLIYTVDLTANPTAVLWFDLYNLYGRFNCQPYRESGVSILAGVDDIQVKGKTPNVKNKNIQEISVNGG